MLHRDRKWSTSERLMEKKLFKNSEKVTVQQEAAKNLSQESICVRGVGDWRNCMENSHPMFTFKQPTLPSSALSDLLTQSNTRTVNPRQSTKLTSSLVKCVTWCMTWKHTLEGNPQLQWLLWVECLLHLSAPTCEVAFYCLYHAMVHHWCILCYYQTDEDYKNTHQSLQQKDKEVIICLLSLPFGVLYLF